MQILYLIIAFILNSVGNVIFKIGATKGIVLHGSFFHIIKGNYLVILGFLFYAINAFFYILALRTLPISIAYPIMLVMSLLLVNIAAIFILHEHLNETQLIGYALLVLGIIIIYHFR